MNNPHDGGVELAHGGIALRIAFDWDAIAIVQARFGREHYLRIVAEAMQWRDVVTLRELVSAATGKTVAEIRAWSPPLLATTEAVETAWLLGMFGPTMTPEASEDADPRKAHPKSAISSALRLLRLSMPASGGPSSGEKRRIKQH
jgi:hypothetical protein